MLKSMRGFTLIHVLVGSTLAITGAFVASLAFNGLFRAQMNERRSLDSQTATNETALFLKMHLGGTRGIQNVNFRVPNTAVGTNPGLQSFGPGVFVLPDTDVTGAGSTGNDSLFLVAKIKDPVELKLNAAIGVGLPIQVAANDAALMPAGFFRPGEYVAISRVQSSDLFRVTLAAPQGPTRVDLTADLGSNASPSVSPAPNLPALYVPGDFLYRVEVFRVGLNATTGAIVAINLWDNTTTQLALLANQFSVEYQISDCTIGTTSVSTPAGTFARDQWTFINGDPNCYRNIQQIRISMRVPPRGPSQQIFPVN